MAKVDSLAVCDTYISFRSPRASSIRSLNQLTQSPEPLRRTGSFISPLRSRSWTIKPQKCLSSYVYNIVVLGSGGVGKTSIIKQYVEGCFPEKHIHTLADVYEKNINRDSNEDDSVYCLKLFDTAGTLSFPAMIRLTIQSGDGFFFVYSIDDRNSFEQVKRLQEEVALVKKGQEIPSILVANKSDLPEERRKITRQEGMKLAKKWGMNFAEISARNKDTTDQIFQILFEEFDTNLADASLVDKRKLADENRRLCKKNMNSSEKKCLIM